MNAERLHAIAFSLKEEADTEFNLLTALTKTLEKYVADPSEADVQKELASNRIKLNEHLSKSATDGFPPSWREALHSLGVDKLLGIQLKKQVDEIFDTNQLTPVVAHTLLKTLTAKVGSFSKGTDDLVNGFDVYGIDDESLAPGECEWGFLIPRKAVGNHLNELGEEFKDLNDILIPFLELTVRGRPQIEVRSISASDFGVYLVGVPAACAAFAKAIQSLVDTYKSLLEIKAHKNGLVKQGIEKESLGVIDDQARSKMECSIKVTVTELLTEYGDHLNSGRRNELRRELTVSLHGIANRIDKGYNVEVRGEPPEADETENADGETAGLNHDYFRIIREAQSTLEFIHQSGESMLRLPTRPEQIADEEAPQPKATAGTAADGKGAKKRTPRKTRAKTDKPKKSKMKGKVDGQP